MRFQLLTTLLAFVFLGVLVLSSGCNKVPVASLVRLARVDFDTTDLSSVRAAIGLPQDLRPLPGTGRLALALMHKNEPAENHVFALREMDDPEALLLNEEGKGGVYAYALPEDAVRTLERLRAKALAARANGKGGSKMTLSIAAKACHLGAAPSGPLPVTTYLKTEETKSFVPLVRNIDLRALTDGKPLDLSPCPAGLETG